ncbi:amidohydrolase, partial [Mycolicibacterium elephantis]
GADERVSADTALSMFFGTPQRPTALRTVDVGQPADLVVLSAPPAEVRGELDADLVAATLIAGEMVYERG